MKQVNNRINVTTGSSDKNIAKTEKSIKGLGKDVKNVNKSTTNLNDSFAVMPGSIGRVVQSFKALKVALLSTGIGAIVVAAGALAGLFAAATKKGADFAKQMSTLQAVSGASAEQMNALSESAKELGSSTQFTAIQVGELQTEFAKMGFSTQQILDSTKATLDLAASMEVDLASAAMLAGSTVNAFGLQAEDTQRVVDVLAKSTSSSALDFNSLTESLKMAAPIAKSTGVSIEETAAMLGVLANTGIKGSLAGTGLSKTFIELNKKGIDLKDALDTVNKSSNGLNTAIDLVGQVGAKSLLNLASKSEDIDKLTISLQESEGAAAAMAEVRLDNLAGDTTKLSSAFEGFLLSIEDGGGLFSKIARLFVQFATSFLTGITKMSNFFGAFITEFNESFAVFHNLKLSASIAIDSIVLGFLNLKGVVAEIPFIGKAIDKKALEESKEATIQSIKESSEGIAYWNGIAEKRRESGLGFFERVNERTKKMAIAAEQKITEAKEVETEKREIISEDEAEKERKRLQKLAEERIKAERKRIQNIAKLEGELFAEVEKLDEEARRRKQTAQQNEIDDLNEKYFRLLNDTRLNEEEKLRLQEHFREEEQAINDKYDKIAKESQEKIAEQEKKTNEERIKGEQTVLEKKLQMTSDALGAISQLVTAFAGADEAEQKKAFKINKALSIAQALVNTALSVTAALTAGGNPIKLATGAQFVEAGIAAALGAAQVAAIAKTRFESSGGGSSSAPSSGLGGAAGGLGSQAPAFNVVGQSGFNQVAQALGQQNSTPIKAFVVSGDVTSAQALENNIIDTATF